MKDKFLTRLCALLSIKSIVTLALTGTFIYQAVSHQIDQQFMTVYTVIIAFYFGTQAQKIQNAINSIEEDNNNDNQNNM